MPNTAQASPCSTLMTVLRGDGECRARREETAAEGMGGGGRPRRARLVLVAFRRLSPSRQGSGLLERTR